MTKYTSAYTDEYIEFRRIVKNSDGKQLAEYKGEETGDLYYFTEEQVESYVVEVNEEAA